MVDRGGDLTVGPPAEGAAILPLHADGVPSLLGKTGVVDHEDRRRIGEGLGLDGPEVSGDLLFVPGILIEELLEGLLGITNGGEFSGPGDAMGSTLLRSPSWSKPRR